LGTLHIAPGYSAGGSLIQALRDIRPDDEVLCWPDDLSCGPIDTNEASARAAWWGFDDGEYNLEFALNEFWTRVFGSKDKLVVWFARHAAGELSFFLNWTDRLENRPYKIIDPTGKRFPFPKKDGSTAMAEPTKAVSLIRPGALASLLNTEREFSAAERELAADHWRRLKAENATFRIVTENGLRSAPADYFDRSLVEEATPDWQRMARLIGATIIKNDEPYHQVGDRMLQVRFVTLVKNGVLLAEGDPWDMRNCRIRLPS
jgi:hypothetical protein